MAKSKDLLAELADLGIELTDDQRRKVEEHKVTLQREAAGEIIGRKLSKKTDKSVESWTTKSFDFAAGMARDFEGAKVGRGRGEVFERVFRVETPSGTFKVSLTEGTSEDSEESESE